MVIMLMHCVEWIPTVTCDLCAKTRPLAVEDGLGSFGRTDELPNGMLD